MVTRKAFTFPHANFIGFDHVWSEIEKLSSVTTTDYPRHNVVKFNDEEFAIELALAGFSRDELDVELKDGVLIVRGKNKDSDGTEYLHKGISTNNFVKTFWLSEHVVVDGADFVDGLLVINLKVELPEEKRPRKIDIGNSGGPNRELLTEES